MKRVLSILIMFTIILNLSVLKVVAEKNKGYFVVTAYYSPLPDQEYYLTGDYESEKRLNGQGIRGASGKGVFSGMLAAPKNYTFGTKIFLEGLGIGVVEDRGGAIVNAGNRGYSYDRIDVWVGYGDEGLRRALYWGKRTVKGNFVNNNNNVTLNYKNIAAPAWATKGLKKIPNIFSKGLGKGSNIGLVKKLQELLKETNLYTGEIDGIYNTEVIDIVYNFQINNEIIKIGDYYGAGYWGKSTRALFLKKYLNGEFDKAQEKVEVETLKKVETYVDIKDEIDLSVFDNAANTLEKIKKLQLILTELGLYEGDLTGVFKDTIDPVYDFQIEAGVVDSIYSPGAGNFGPKTRLAMKIAYVDLKESEKQLALDKAKKEEEAKLEALRIEEENRKAQERQKELEEKYRKLEELSLKKAEEKLRFIGTPIFGEVSHSVRELQKTLKELGFFKAKDTAIYGPITKESIIAYQIDKNLISINTDPGAGSIGPKTRNALKNDLKEKFMQEMVVNENISEVEVALVIGDKM